MTTLQKTLDGKIPVTEENLHFFAKKHKKYDLTKLDVSQVSDFSHLFEGQFDFNQPIGNWDVSNGTNFYAMFENAKFFNQPIGNWDVSNGTEFSFMFNSANSFNQPIGNWNVSNGTDFLFMFNSANSFNQDITDWKIKKKNWLQMSKTNFNISVKHSFEKIGFTENTDHLSLLFKDSPDSPFLKDFNYKKKELTLIKSNNFYGFMDNNNNFYQIDTDKITIDELIDICDIKIY